MKAERIKARIEAIAVSRKRLENKIAGGHPNSAAYEKRLAEFDNSIKRLELLQQLRALDEPKGKKGVEISPPAAR